ncbi:MAG: hypothetical protein J5611_02730 [Alphaproteobacteria bacterium]|nr:hypothetical protein [Alphaproteobacteria bacterium]
MKNILVVFLIFVGCLDAAVAATAGGVRSRTSATTEQATQTARSARRSTSETAVVSRGSATQVAQPTVQQRGRATTQNNVAAQTVSRGRAAKTQSVVGSGTKVAAAAQNTLVDEECLNKFNGCMDSFCMMDNANGGRCMCSDKNSEYDAILAEIQKLDTQSYEMATAGVEKIQMGEDGEAVMAKVDAITKSVAGDKNQSKRDLLDFSNWNSSVEFDDMQDIFATADDDISKQTGDKLFRASADLCNAQIPECSAHKTMMESMYKQRVRSDCAAYENSLKQQRTQSAQKLAAAQNAMREAALEQYRSANKYDLGQCTFQFKQCMQTTGGCGEDFSGCVTSDYISKQLKKKTSQKTQIQGALTVIEIAASTYDSLESKKPLCMDVTKQCVAVRDQVWDTFLREVAPELKSAELIAENNVRSSCISNISQCFQKACKDNIDPKDPEGSYDLCLTRPNTFRSLCKVEIEPCEAMDKKIIESVYARLASMRVDSCTKAFKSCLQNEDRCGENYTQCVGLDTDTIVGLCPAETLTACMYEGQGKNVKKSEEIYEELLKVAEGVFLSIDSNMLTQCQKAADAAMVKVCGDTASCDAFAEDSVIGTESLISYEDGEGGTVLDGLANFKLLTLNQNETNQQGNQKVTYDIDYGGYKSMFDAPSSKNAVTVARIKSAMDSLIMSVKQKLDIIAKDPVVDVCLNGREQTWRYSANRDDGEYNKFTRFPHLLDTYGSKIFESAVSQATANYESKYNDFISEAAKARDQDKKAAMCLSIASNVEDKQIKEGDIEIGYVFGHIDTSATGYSEYELTVPGDDGKPVVVTKVNKTAIYSPSTEMCIIKTVTQNCKDQSILSCVGFSGSGTDRKCDGYLLVYKPCIKWQTPVETTQEIQM